MATSTPVTLAVWQQEHAGIINGIFAENGPLTRLIPDYRPQPGQIKMAHAIAQSLIRGMDNPGRITLQQASTGTGKGLAYGIPVAIHTVLAKRRAVISTYTIALQRQWLESEGPVSAAIARQMTGIEPTIALRRSKRQFVDPERARTYANAIATKADLPAPIAKATANALISLALYAEIETERARKGETGPLDGLITTWAEVNPDEWELLRNIPQERYSLVQSSSDDALLLYRRFAQQGITADLLIATHAATAIDLKLNGQILDPERIGLAGIVFDEADVLPDVAEQIASAKYSISSMERSLTNLTKTLKLSDASHELTDLVDNRVQQATVAIAAIREDAARSKHLVAANVIYLKPADDLSRHIRSLDDALAGLLRILDTGLTQPAKNITYSIDTLDEIDQIGKYSLFVNMFVREIDEKRNISRGYPAISFSPIREDPSLTIISRGPRMLLSRLWQQKSPRADAIVFTSATLATPGTPEATAFRSIVSRLGLGKHQAIINDDLTGIHEPENFGKLSFVLAHPDAPVPGIAEEGPDDTPDWAAYAARTVIEASHRRTSSGRSNVLVLTTSFATTAHIAFQLHEIDPDKLLARLPGISMYEALSWFSDGPDRILVTPGAWSGVNLPGWIDHLVIPRLPFPPPRMTPPGDTVPFGFGQIDTMMRTLKQGTGRAIRKASDAATIWITDPRFGLPVRLSGRLGLLPHPRSLPIYKGVIEERFRINLDQAEILDPRSGTIPVVQRQTSRNR